MARPYQLTKMKNGMSRLLIPVAGTSAITVFVLVPVGSRQETDVIAGASHFIEHLFFKGTERRPTAMEISRTLDALGAEYNAFTGKEYTGYYIKVAAEHTALACDMLADMLGGSVFAPEEVERERGVIIEEIHLYEDNPAMHIDDLLEAALYPGTALGRNIAGSRETVTKMQREDVLAYRDREYRPERMVVALAGAVPKNAVALCEKTFGALTAKSKQKPAKLSRVAFAKNAPAVLKEDRPTEQVQLSLGMPAFARRDARNLALSLLSIILGGTMSSRLFHEVRERRGLCYSIRTSSHAYQDIGTFSIDAGLAKDRVPEAIAVIVEELQKVVQHGITKEELTFAKANARGRFVLDLEESNAVADFYARQFLFSDTIRTPEERMARLERVTLAQVRQVAKTVFVPKHMRLAVIGPSLNSTALAKALMHV